MAKIEYGSGNSISGTDSAPYYTLGSVRSGAIGNYSLLVGSGTASGYKSISMGNGCTASGSVSVAIGNNSTATSDYCISIGNSSSSKSVGAISLGENAIASGSHSVAIGTYVASTSNYNTVIGKYNAATVSSNGSYLDVGDYAFIIGNGTANTTADRSNALTVDWNGNLWTANNVSALSLNVGTNRNSMVVDSSGNTTISGDATVYGTLVVNDTITGYINGCYGTSNTGATTQAKAVTSPGFVLYAGALITVKFSTANTYSSAKIQLNVNTTGAKDIWIAGASTSATNQLLWGTNATITFRYDGTQFIVVGDPATYYGASTTAASTAAKTDTTACTSAVIRKGTVVRLSMTNANTAASPTLNINGTGAKAIYAGLGTSTRPLVSNGLSWTDGSTVGFVFDGQYWRVGETAGLASAYEASKVATNFITPVTNAGIQLHEANNTNDYYQIRTTGHYFYNNGTQIAAFQYDSGEEEAYYTLGTRALPSTFGSYSTTIGIGNAATSSCSTAIGLEAKAQGFCAIAIGQYTKAYAQNSMACGLGIVTTSSYSTAMGKYNTATRSGSGSTSSPYTYTDAGDYVLIIGNGTGDATEDRSNALTVDWSGNLVASGSVSDADGSLGVKVVDHGFVIQTGSGNNGTGTFTLSSAESSGYLTTNIVQIWPMGTWTNANATVAQIARSGSQITVTLASMSAQQYSVVAQVLYRG